MAFRPAVMTYEADLVVVSLPDIDPVPADYPPEVYYRDSWHYSAPVFDPDDEWSHPQQEVSRPVGEPDGRVKWGRYQIHIGDRDRSFFRGVRVQVLSWSRATPFGPRSCLLRFPQITPFEKLGVDIPWLHDHAKLGLHRIKDDGTIDRGWNWNGIKHSSHLSWTPDGWAVDVEFKGFLHQAMDANNRPTRPAGAMHAADIGYRIPHRLNQIIGRKFKRIAKVVTGIEQWKKGALTDSVEAFVLQLLALAWTDDGVAWALTDRPNRRWQAHLVLPDPDTVDYTLALGTQGMELELDEDDDELPNVIYGEWVTPDGARTQNLKYPHLRASAAPDFPLGLGASFTPGGPESGFRPFARWLARNGYKIHSDDTYDARDEDEVIDAQDRMGVTDDGVVNATTWGTAFDVGAGNFSDAIYLPIAWDKRVEPYLYTPDGVKIGRNPDYDPSIPRRERYVNFGENVERSDVKQAARQMVARSKKRSLVGVITTRSDPEECSRRDMREGTTLAVPYLDGTGAGGVKFHVVDVTMNEETGAAQLTVDTLWRDAYTVTQIIERNREARHNPARLRRQNASDLTQDTQPVFDRDNGAGDLGTIPVDGGVWRVVPFPASAWGTFVRVHAETSPNVEFALSLFAGKVTSNFCQRNVGDPLASDHPYKAHAAELKDAGLIIPWGSKEQPLGYSKPNSADGYKTPDGDPLTGRFEYDSGVKWWSERPPLLYLAIWAAADTEITVRFYNEPVTF